MRRILPFLFLSLLAPAPAQAQKPTLDVDYDGAGLTRLHVHNGALTYVWYTGRKHPETGMPDMRQSLEAYDKHVFQTRLTPAQTAWLNAWAMRNHVFTLRRRYPTTQPRSYGTAFRFFLTVRRGSETRICTWDDTSRAEPAWTAAQELTAWCGRLLPSSSLNPR